MIDEDGPTAPHAWQIKWETAFESLATDLAKENTILPKEGWMLTTVRTKHGERIITHSFSDEIITWCKHHNIKINVGVVGVHGHDLPTMVFNSFADLFLFKLEFEG